MDAELNVLEPHTPYDPSPPHVIVRGSGVRVWDDTGREFLDGVAGLWCVSLGYSQPRLVKAATDQLERLPFYGSFSHRTNDVALALAADLAVLAPMSSCRVFFANSGSEANDSAIKLAWYYQTARGERDRTVILSHEGGYHGSTAAAASATGMPHMHGGFGPLPLSMFERLANPDPQGPLAAGASTAEFEERLLAEAEKTILRIGPDRVAAMIAEPVLGAGGLIIPPAGYLRRLRELLHKYGILLILDEVITAFGRTGRMFGSQHFNVEPDIVTVAKGLSSGYLPISAVLVSDQVCAAIDDASRQRGTLGHGFTYSGHPVSAAVARETLRILTGQDVPRHVRDVAGPALARGVADLADAPGVRGVRSLGLLAAVDLETTGKAGEAGRHAAAEAVDHGLIVRPIGDTLIFAPPLVSTPEELSEMTERLDTTLNRRSVAVGGGAR